MKKRILDLLKNKEVILYLVFGVLTTIINFIVYTFLTRTFSQDEIIANSFAWVIAVIFAYITNKTYVFTSKTYTFNELTREILAFFLARIFSLGVDTLIMFIGIKILFIYDLYVKFVAQVVIVILNYVLSKFIIFKKGKSNVQS